MGATARLISADGAQVIKWAAVVSLNRRAEAEPPLAAEKQ